MINGDANPEVEGVDEVELLLHCEDAVEVVVTLVPAATRYQASILEAMLEYSMARWGSEEQEQLSSCKMLSTASFVIVKEESKDSWVRVGLVRVALASMVFNVSSVE